MNKYCKVITDTGEVFYEEFRTHNFASLPHSIQITNRPDITEVIFSEDEFDIIKFNENITTDSGDILVVDDSMVEFSSNIRFLFSITNCPNLKRVHIPSYLNIFRCTEFNVKLTGSFENCEIDLGEMSTFNFLPLSINVPARSIPLDLIPVVPTNGIS